MNHHGFLYGACTSAHQVEGSSVNNQWWVWEQGRPRKFRSGAACDHWNRYKEDFALAKNLGHTAHRFSLEWSKIEPTQGKFDQAVIEHYRDVLKELRGLGMKTIVTLHHFTNPLWFERRGGWKDGQSVELFNTYVRYCAQHLGDLVDYWITINEPMVYAVQSYYAGVWPPQEKNIFSMMRVVRNMARAHRNAYRILHSVTSHVPVGLANSQVYYGSHKKLNDWFFNHRFFSLIKNKQDFIGVNYYFADDAVDPHAPRTDLGWTIYPKGLTEILLALKKYHKPIIITENGIADAKDIHRGDYIRSHLRAIEQAQQQGVDVRGYLHWALIDNFEWAEGFDARFGLIEVDYKTQQRTIRPSAYVYKAIIEQASCGIIPSNDTQRKSRV